MDFAAAQPSSLYWPHHFAPHTMDALVLPSSGWLKTACIVTALFWVAFRAYRVLVQPVEQLVKVLGLEVPVAPIVSLAGIRCDGVLLHWKPPDQRVSVLKYVIRVNGIDIGDVMPQETSITIENLQPDHHYKLRIVTLNSANFQAPSAPIRLRTLPAASNQYFGSPTKDFQPLDDNHTPTPTIRPNKNLVDMNLPTFAPAMAREHSNSTSRARRSEGGRRNSPASQTTEQARSAQAAADSMETIKQLTEQLDSVRRENDDVERQIQEEEEEFQAQKTSLSEKRDEKKASLKEKEDVSRELRREVANLERQNTAAQTKKAQEEKRLRQKEAERKKLKDDMARWGREMEGFRETVERIKVERSEYEASSETRIQELKDKLAQELQTNKTQEEAIRERGIQVKSLEEERKKLEEGQEGADVSDGNDPLDREAEEGWHQTWSELQRRYAHAWMTLTHAEQAAQQTTARLQLAQQRRLSQPQLFGGMPSQEFGPVRRNSQRSRPLSMREPLASLAPGGFVPSTAAPFNSNPPAAPSTYGSATPYFNPVNGMAIPPRNHTASFSQTDIESLTGGAPMSPTAGALLPAGLFGDESGLTDAEDDDDDPGPPQPFLAPSPDMRPRLPGLGAPGTIEKVQSPSSPVSTQSQSPSAFASPRNSAGQLAHFPGNENAADSDKRSIRSTSSSFMSNLQASRTGGLFGLSRQRGKTISDQGPALGSLKPAQSQSLPRQEPGSQDPIGTQRRRGSHSGGAWYDTFKRTSTQPLESSNSPKHVATRKRAFNMFGTKGDPWLTSALGLERPSSPRQGSTKSGEGNLLPRPSAESQTRFGWSIDTLGQRGSPLSVDWSMNNNQSSWSRMPSRRPSIQHGSSASLLNDELLQDDVPDFLATTRSPTQAPIGTRPQSSASHMPAQQAPALVPPTPPKQLNPAAPHFKSIFSRERKNEEDKAKKAAEKEAKKAEKKEEKEKKAKEAKAEKSEKAARKGKDKMISSEMSESSSPMDASKETLGTPSISTADASDASPRESLERSVSQTPSESQAPSIGKDSWMSKLSRKKSSSSQGFLGQISSIKSSRFSSKKADVVTTPDEVDEEGGFLGIGKGTGTDSTGHSPSIGTPKDKDKDKSSSLSWSSISNRVRRRDKTPSLHESIASETTENTGDEDEGATGSTTLSAT